LEGGADCAYVVFEGEEKVIEQRKRVELRKEALEVEQAERERESGGVVRMGKDGVNVVNIERVESA